MRDTRRLRGILTSATAAVALTAGALAFGAAPAHAASATGFGNGTVGVSQTIIASGICQGVPLTLFATYSNGVQVASAPVTADGDGNATIVWTPPQVGVITSAVIGSTCTPWQLGGATISAVGTSTTVISPNIVQVGVPTLINVTVQAWSRSAYNPTGTVTVRDASGNIVVTMGLTPGTISGPATGISFAFWRWTPPAAGTYSFTATYSGDGQATASVSVADIVSATQSGGTISLSAPPTMTKGVPVTLIASLFPNTTQGSVGFTLNGAPISASIPIVNGIASFNWTPNVVGAVTLGANYMTNGGGSGSTTDAVVIGAGPIFTDAITLTQPGYGTWAPNGTYTLGNGTSFTFQASTLSGAPVTLTNAGPCNNTGLTLTIDTGSGQCSLVAKSAGGNGFAAVSQGYTVTMVPGQQTAALAAPNSGRFKVGQTLRLQNPAQGQTNAKQNVTWRITQGRNTVCSLRYPSNGAVNVRMNKRGTCTVVAQAPAVANQWAAFRLQRNYTAR
ncbi:MAG: Ig-like domain repeat protein [Actinobacteria bacterium]|nr:Ig-like domain repeat protein [Actinomycetota bacterium]